MGKLGALLSDANDARTLPALHPHRAVSDFLVGDLVLGFTARTDELHSIRGEDYPKSSGR